MFRSCNVCKAYSTDGLVQDIPKCGTALLTHPGGSLGGMFQTQGVGSFLALPSLWPLISQQQPNLWFLGLKGGAAEMHECVVVPAGRLALPPFSCFSLKDVCWASRPFSSLSLVRLTGREE